MSQVLLKKHWNVWSSLKVCFASHSFEFYLCKYHQIVLQSKEILVDLHTDISIFNYQELSIAFVLCPYLLFKLNWWLSLWCLFRLQSVLYKLVFQNFTKLTLKQFLNTSQCQTVTFKLTNKLTSFSLKTSIQEG